MAGLKLSIHSAPNPAWWPQGASFAADFSSNRYMVFGRAVRAEDILDFSRPTPKYAQDAAGDWHRFDAGVMARTCRGILLECAASEYVPRNTILGELPATGPGAIVSGWSLFGGEPGSVHLLAEQRVRNVQTQPFRLLGGASPVGLGTTALSHLAGQPYTLSLYARRAPGAPPADLAWHSPLGTGTAPIVVPAASLGASWERYDLTVTAPTTGASPLILAVAADAPAGGAVEWALPMLRDTGATSFISSLGAGGGRATDFLQVPTEAIGLTPQQGTVIVRNTWGAIIPYNRAIDISDGGTDNRINIERVGGTSGFQATLRSGGEIVGVTEALTGFDDGEYHVQGVSWSGEIGLRLTADASGEMITGDVTMPQSFSMLKIGGGAGDDVNRVPNGYIGVVWSYDALPPTTSES